MNRLFTLLLGLLIWLPTRGQFRYQPERPRVDGVVSFTYVPTESLANASGAILALVQRYGSPTDMRVSQPETVTTTRTGDLVTGTLKVPFKEVAGLLVAFRNQNNPRLIDHNNGHFYAIPLYSKTGALLPHATGGQASVMMRTSFPYQLKIKPDWAWVVDRYEQEIAEFPATRPLYWADLIRAKLQRAEGNPAAKAEALTNINAYLTDRQPTPTPADLTAAAQLYDLLKEPALALNARSRIKAVDPNRPEAQKERAEAIQAEPNLGRKRASFDAFVMATPRSPYREMVVSAVAEAYFNADKLGELVQFMGAEAAPATNPALLLGFARQLTSQGRGLPQAEWLAGRALWAFQKKPLPAGTSPQLATERAAQLRTAQATVASAVDQQGRFPDALNHYRMAATGLPVKLTDPLTNERTWFCAMQATRADSVWPFIEQVVQTGRTTPKLRTDVRQWLNAPRGTDPPARKAAYQRTLAQLDRLDRRTELVGSLIDESAPDFALKTLSGRAISLAALRGKIAVLNLWATNCEACQASFPALRQVRSQLGNDPRVQLFSVNTHETGSLKQVRSFTTKRAAPNEILLDPDQLLSVAYNINRLPATVIIDDRGRIRYRSDTPINVGELTLLIEALKQ